MNKIKKFNKRRQQNDDFIPNEDFEESKKWYEQIPEDPQRFEKVTDEQLIALKDEAKRSYDSDCLNFNSKRVKSNSDQWMKSILSKGTVSDKIAAYTITIQNSPLYSLDSIQKMVNLVKVSKKECNQLIEVLTELFLNDLLHPNRKLKQFQERPLSLLNELSSGNAKQRNNYLIYWYFEDQLKQTYTSFVMALNKVSQDALEINKEKAIGAMYRLLADNAEQEKNLLAFIVNKLGDPSQKIASKVIYCLTQLLHKHLNMQGVVLLEVERLLFRTNVRKKAQYYALCFLSQYYLSHDESEIAKKLIEVYFSFFKACIKLGEVDSRMMSALLIGVNRAYPYAKLEMDKISEHIDAMYKIVHIANFNVSLNALTLLYQVADFCDVVNDRFYSALYRKLLDPEVCQTTHQAMLLNLVFKALKRDKETHRVKVFIKRLLQLAMHMIPPLACGVLFLISNLIGNSSELLADNFKQEHIRNTKKESIEELPNKEEIDSGSEKELDNVSGDDIIKKENDKATKKVNFYDGLHRNPLYAGGEFCCYLELILLTNHFHPTVNLFANQILNGEKIRYSGDPLIDFTLIRFLDRFVYKNPKKIEDIDKKGCNTIFGRRNTYVPKGIKSIPIKSKDYLSQNEHKIPVDERFLFLYLQKKNSEKLENAEEDQNESDVESVGSEEFEDMLDKMAPYKGNDDDLDYMNDIGQKLKEKGKNDTQEASDEEEIFSEDENDEELNDEFDKDEDDDDELLEDLSDDEDVSDLEFNSEEEDDVSKKINMKKTREDIQNIFASAEEFASLLEDEGSSKTAPGSAQALANKDNADLKQIAWEQKRNHWVSGFDKFVGNKRKKQNSKFKKNKKVKSKK